jgi:transcriptional regulator with XRE-family HTH domain
MNHIFSIASRLKQHAKAKNISIVQLQRQTGLSALTISAALSGKKDSQISTWLAIASALDLSFLLLPNTAAQLIDAQYTGQPQSPAALSWVDVALNQATLGGA